MWKQIRAFNQSSAGRKPGYCLQNVRLGFGIAAKYPTAIAAWWATQSHKDRNIPTGIDVLLFYSYKVAGHVNVRLANGKVWSDGVTYASLDAYEKSHPAVHYLGWGESLNGVAVIQNIADPVASAIRINPGAWNVRKGPSTSFGIIGQCHGGEKYAASFNGSWAQITFTGKTGYVGPAAYKKI